MLLLSTSVESIISNFADILQFTGTPVYNGKSGYYRPDKTLTNKTGQQQHLQDPQLLFEYLPEIAKMTRIDLTPPAQDDLTIGLREMMGKGMTGEKSIQALPMFAIFLTKLLLAVHHVLRIDAIKPFEELQATAKRCIATIDDWLEFVSPKTFELWPADNNKWLQHIKDVAKTALEDFRGTIDLGVPEQSKPKPFHFLSMNPVYCGLLQLRLNLALQEAGQTIVGAWGSAIYPIHLYNACRQSGGLNVEWQDAEYLYQLHTPQRIFVGSPPKDSQEYLKRFFLMLGGSASDLARNRRQGGKNMLVEPKKGPRGLKITSPVRDMFQPRYVESGNAVLCTGNLSAAVAVANKAQRTHVPLTDVEHVAQEVVSQPQMTPVQLLTCVREGVAAEEMHLLYNYFGLHKRSIQLLRTLKDALDEDMVEYFGETWIENEITDVVGYNFEIVYKADQAAEHLKLPYHGSKILNKASDILKTFLEQGRQKGDNGVEGVARARGQTCAVQYAHLTGKPESVQVWDPQVMQNAQRGGR